MHSGFRLRSVILFFVAVLALYLLVFYGIEHLRERKGGWVVDFRSSTNPENAPALLVSQASLALTNITILFHGEHATNPPGRVVFDRVRQPVPMGRVLYEDLTFLPGVVTFELFGHEVELLPRTLVVNQSLIPWRSGMTVDLWPTNKPATPPQPPKGHRRAATKPVSFERSAPALDGPAPISSATSRCFNLLAAAARAAEHPLSFAQGKLSANL
jgi:hypothetical protein